MNNDFYTDSDSGLEIDRLSEAEVNEYSDIEGIETDEEYAFKEDPTEEVTTSVGSEPPREPRSTPEHPLYDPKTGELIPYGMTLKEWLRRKKEAARKKQIIKAHIIQDTIDSDESRLKQGKREELNFQGNRTNRATQANVEYTANKLAGHGEDSIITSTVTVEHTETMHPHADSASSKPFDKKNSNTGKSPHMKSPLPPASDTARDSLEALGMVALHNIRSADESEENDVKHGVETVKHAVDHIHMLLGTSGMLAAASLDAAMGARQSDLMDKCISKGIDLEIITKPASKEARINYLQDKGFTKYEARDILKKGLGGISVADNLQLASKARTELINAASAHIINLTDEEIKFLKSKAFFNTSKNSRQISAITRKYFDSCNNSHQKKFNPATGYLTILRSRENSRKLGPGIITKPGIVSKTTESLNPHTYNLRVSLSKEVLRNRYRVKLDRVLKKNHVSLSSEQKILLSFQESVERQASYVERRRIFKKNKFSVKNIMSAGLTCFRELDSDTAKGLDQILSVKNGAEAAYSLMRLGAESVWTAGKPLRILADKTGITGAVTASINKAKEDALFAINAKKKKVITTARTSTAGKSLSKARTSLRTSKPALKVASRHSSLRATKQTISKRITYRKQQIRTQVMNNPIARIILTPFKGIASLSKAVNTIKDVLHAIGHWILLAIGVTIVIWLVLLLITGFMMTLGKNLDITGRYVIMADQDLIDKWIAGYLLKDDTKYEEAISHADDEPIDPHAWGGTKLYHYGVYEQPGSSYFNRTNTSCYYHEKDQHKRYGASNGFHVIYIDSNGNTLGNNTTNVKDVVSLATVMAGNDWYSYQTEAEDLMDKLYITLNPEPALVESEIYACSTGCDTYPRKHIDGDPSNGNNWYQWAYRAYECNDPAIYSEYDRLLLEGVKFYPDDTYTYSSHEYFERLVPQTTDGCNKTADFSFERVRVPDSYNSRGLPRYTYQLIGIDYSAFCGGQTYNYKYSDSGCYYRNSDTDPDTYAPMYYSDDEHIGELNNAGFYGRYSRDYSNTIPHTAIKCCYGHKDLNIYITVLTKEDLINARGGAIEYRIPVHFSHETGEITEWETRHTMNINTYTRTNTNLQELTKVFYEKGGFDSEENLTTLDQIFGEDWYDLYGISIYNGAAIPDTLSREARVNRLDYAALTDISELRTNLVQLSYNQVGRIPYYWGGKASSTNLYANDFGSRVDPDYKGRTRKGLDCSGFVQLMFCMASGAELNEVGSTTSSLVPSLGLERESYADLKPGDIGMENLPGVASNHIGIYAGNGMWIHCQGAPTNTVVYNNTNCFKYYYSLGD